MNYLAAVLLGATVLSALAAPTGAQTAPTVTGVTLSSAYPANGADGAFIAGDRILVIVTFSDFVRVTGTPRIALTIGSVTRYAHYDGSRSWSSTTPEFLYKVQSEDLDNDGISIGATALELGGGTIRDDSGDSANLSLVGHTITDDTDFIVDGGGADVRAPTVLSVAIQGCDRFLPDDVIQAMVTFTEPVTATGTPRLALTIGDATRYADLAGEPRPPKPLPFPFGFLSGDEDEEDAIESFENVRVLYFTYTLRSSDPDDLGEVDTSEISVGVTALERNGGAIRDAASLDADLSLTGKEVLWWKRANSPFDLASASGYRPAGIPLPPFVPCYRVDTFPSPYLLGFFGE